VITLSLIPPLLLALHGDDGGFTPLLTSIVIGAATGVALLALRRREPVEISRREGMLFVCLVWITAVALGALPFYFSPDFPSFADAFFESMSGFTTTGATVLVEIEKLPSSLHLWRAMTHWLGGMGIIVLGIAILPLLGTGGMELYRAEFSGARSERLTPRIAETALAFWKIYSLMSLAEYLALRLAGMGPLDAACHTFGTMGTGGFSTRALSVESFQSAAVEYILIFFMLVAGMNFTVHYKFFVERRWPSFFRDTEIRVYIGIVFLATGLITFVLLPSGGMDFESTFRAALFQSTSILTTTGFSSKDFEVWPHFATFVLLILMFIGGCTGSTAGGMKVARIILLFKTVGREFRRMAEKRGVFTVRFEGRAVHENTISSLLNLVYVAFLVNFAGCLILTAFGLDLVTAFSAVAACMFNVGPGLGLVGPADNYLHLPHFVKWTLSFCMLAGRLEYFTIFVVMTRAFWRK